MKVLLLTVFLSLLLAVLFLLFFIMQYKNKDLNTIEQNALRPLDKEESKIVSRK